jgi:hypothetical protein
MMNKMHTPEDKPANSKSVEVGGHVGSLHLLAGGERRYELRIDREGRWFHEGIEIVREDIRNLFSRHLTIDADGDYVVRIGHDECHVIVEDAPFVVIRVSDESESVLTLLLNDGDKVLLNPHTIEFKNSNVPYCRVRGGLRARFSRPAYYQLAEFIKYNEKTERFHLAYDGEYVELDVAREE